MSLTRSNSVPHSFHSASASSQWSYSQSSTPRPAPHHKARLHRYHSADAVNDPYPNFLSLPSTVPQTQDDPFSLTGFFPLRFCLSDCNDRDEEWKWLRADGEEEEDSPYPCEQDQSSGAKHKLAGWTVEPSPRAARGEAEAGPVNVKFEKTLGVVAIHDIYPGMNGLHDQSGPPYSAEGAFHDEGLYGPFWALRQAYEGSRDDDRYAVTLCDLFSPENDTEDKVLQRGVWETMVCRMMDLLVP